MTEDVSIRIRELDRLVTRRLENCEDGEDVRNIVYSAFREVGMRETAEMYKRRIEEPSE